MIPPVIVPITGSDVIARLNEIRRIEPGIDAQLRRLSSLGPVALVGGAIRDWQHERNHRDLDFVVDTTPALLHAAFSDFETVENSFKGIRATIGGQEIDAWPLSHTLAFLVGDIEPPFTFKRLPFTTFLNADSANVRLDTAELSEHGFFDGIRDEVLELNLGGNPFPTYCAAKALVLAERHGWALGPELVQWFRRPRGDISFAEGYSKSGLERGEVERMIARRYPAHKYSGHIASRYGLFPLADSDPQTTL